MSVLIAKIIQLLMHHLSKEHALAEGLDRVTDLELRSLAPEYKDDHHKTYVSRLNAAVSDPRNKNIALTGRYGAGKSSILDEFVTHQETPPRKRKREEKEAFRTDKRKRKKCSPAKVLRISISTLGPDKSEDLTNRIQKEMVKQLVYRAKPGRIRSSEFARTPKLTWWRALLEALVVTVPLVGILWLFGLRPNDEHLGADGFPWPMVVFLALVTAILWAIRWYVGSRVVAQVAAGGASITLEGRSDSFFDKYLDELITFFETTKPDIVIFEDLDRFDDPRIFDSLRELNSLVNTSAHWKNRSHNPLQFVYAIKDSLFEKLGDEQREKDNDSNGNSDVSCGLPVAEKGSRRKDAVAESIERANRTKFFDIVIPVVPFLSHSNARDHFLKELAKLNFPKGTNIDHGLIDTVARHTTDMRLMINIGNEFVVYAERLLWVAEEKRAPGLNANLLFALVVYKNFHLTDFEDLPNRGSALDKLDQYRRILVNSSIASLQGVRRDLVHGVTRQQRQQDLAEKLGRRLQMILDFTNLDLQKAAVRDDSLKVSEINDPAFWGPVGRGASLKLTLGHARFNQSHSAAIEGAELKELFPEAANPTEWFDTSSTPDDLKRIDEIDAQIATLRGADFDSLVNEERYTHEGISFSTFAEENLPSDLAFDLVKQGRIDRFYAEYTSVFHGDFLGVDVAKFFRNCVWPNEMDMQFAFTTEGAVENILAQAPDDFLRTRSALNIEIVNYLIVVENSSLSDFIDFLIQPNNTEAKQFLETYFQTPGSEGAKLVSRLSTERWPALFSFIASEATNDAVDQHVELLNAALLSAPDFETFELDDKVRGLIRNLHTEIPAFRDPQPVEFIETHFSFLIDSVPSIPDLRAISTELRQVAVYGKEYDLSAHNVRCAASLSDEESISADKLIEKPDVWAYCTQSIDAYLAVVEGDTHTDCSCTSPNVLAQVIDAQHETWSTEQLGAFLNASADSAALRDITEIQQAAWQTTAKASRAIPNVTNLIHYTDEFGVDAALAELLTEGDDAVVDIIDLEKASGEDLESLIPLLLNAQTLPNPRQRVELVQQMRGAPTEPSLNLSEVIASPDGLLAELLREKLVEDGNEVFVHFLEAGWPSVGPALRVSKNAPTFIVPEFIEGHEAEFMRDEVIPEATKRVVLQRLTEFSPSEGEAFLRLAASIARDLDVRLSVDALKLIAPTSGTHENILRQLHLQGNSIKAADVMQILGRMPGDFVGFSRASGEKFEVTDVQYLKSVVDRLKEAGEIAFQPGGRPKGRLKLRIV